MLLLRPIVLTHLRRQEPSRSMLCKKPCRMLGVFPHYFTVDFLTDVLEGPTPHNARGRCFPDTFVGERPVMMSEGCR